MSFGKALAGVQGTVREDKLPMWSPKLLLAAVVGIVAGFDEYPTKEVKADAEKGIKAEASRMVKYVKLSGVLEFAPATDDAPERVTEHLALGVQINADLKVKLDSDTLPAGSIVLIQHNEIAAQFNNMRRYRVETLTRQQYVALMKAAAE